MVQQLSDRGGDLIERLETASEETSRAIATASEQLTRSLNFKADHVTEEFAEIAGGLEDMMTARLDRVTEGFSEKSLAILDMRRGMGSRGSWSISSAMCSRRRSSAPP